MSFNTLEEEPKEEEDVLADIPTEGEEVPLVDEEITSPDSPAEEKPVVEEPSQEGDNIPLEEDNDYKTKTGRRVQQLLKERAEEREARIALEERLKAIEERSVPQEEENIPEEWSELFSTGDPDQDRIAYTKHQAMNARDKAAWKEEVLAELKGQESQESEEQEQFAQAYENQMDELEESGKTFDRNELMAYITKRPIFRQDGQPDFETALELMEAKKPKANIAARKSMATINQQGATNAKGYATPEDLKGGWNSIGA